MLKTIVVLSDGTEISTDVNKFPAIRSVTIKESVNDSLELSLGSTFSNFLDISLITPGGDLSISAGDELTVYKEDDFGTRHKVGIFTTEKPTRPTANTMKLTAYDRVSWLDKDLSLWLAALPDWPYKLFDFAGLVCDACGLALVNESLPNGDYEIQAFSAEGISGRKLMQWVGQIAGRFCRATADGEIEFAWYTPSGVTITPSGDRFYYQNSLRFEDYQTALIEKVQLHLTQDDVGAVWPDGEGEKNTYSITGNYLLTTQTTDTLQPLAQTLYEQLKDVTYTPCSVAVPACLDIHAGHTVQITDLNGRTISAYVMTKTQKGQRDTIECTGSYRRDSFSAFNNQSYKALNGKILELRQQVEGFSVKAAELQTDMTANEEGLQEVRENVAQLSVEADGIKTDVSNTQTAVDKVSGELKQTNTRLTAVEQTSENLQINVQSINENGVTKVTTTTGYTFNEEGMEVDKTDSPTKTTVTSNGMNVYSKTGGEAPVLSATSEGVDATDLHAKTYLTVGGRIRFENYGTDRVGCYWIGGS